MTTDARKLAEQCVSAAPGTDDNDLITFTAIISAALRERDERLTTLYNNANTIAAKWKSEAEAAEQRVAGLDLRLKYDESQVQLAEAQRIQLGLRKRVHFLTGHNQWFERCESLWCHPQIDFDPALDWENAEHANFRDQLRHDLAAAQRRVEELREAAQLTMDYLMLPAAKFDHKYPQYIQNTSEEMHQILGDALRKALKKRGSR